jgi:P27 family predicted phage terminase small subunit
MGRNGPPSQATALKIIRNKNTMSNENSPEIVDEFSAPDYLTDEGRQVWENLVPRMRDKNLLSDVDLNAFARYCDILPKWLKAKRVIDEQGFYYVIYAKQTKAEIELNLPPRVRFMQTLPEVPIYRDFGKELSRLEKVFGLTPAARSVIKVGKTAGVSATAKKLFG